MEFELFKKPTVNENPLFQDTEKVKEIRDKLCNNRKSLEDSIAVCEDSTREEKALELVEIKKDMTAFGISEIDYEVYLVTSQKGLS